MAFNVVPLFFILVILGCLPIYKLLHFVVKCKNNDLWSYLMRNFKKTLSILLSTVIIVFISCKVSVQPFLPQPMNTHTKL